MIEYTTTLDIKTMQDLRLELNIALKNTKDIELTNNDTGLKASISQHEINKISNPKAVHKSIANGFNKEEHFEIAKHIATLYQLAKLHKKHIDNKGRGWEVYRLVANVKVNNKQAQIKITAFKKQVGKNRIYTIELGRLNLLP